MKIHCYAAKPRHPLYAAWTAIKGRCYNKNNKDYMNYGARGIIMCNEWIADPIKFVNWGLINGWERGLFIDRINNDSNYSPENCRFLTIAESNKNQQLLKRTNTSGYRGVSYDKSKRKWVGSVSVKKKHAYSIRTSNKIDAAVKRDSYVISNNLGTPLNFPQKNGVFDSRFILI